MLLWLARRRFAVASCLVASSLLLSSCDTLRSARGLPSQPEPKVTTAPAKPLPPANQPPPSPADGTASVPPSPLMTMENVAPEEEHSVKVALLLPLSGRLANLGKAMSDAAQMAMFDLADRRFELMPIDDKGTTGGSADAARQAISNGAQLIVGPLLAGSVRAVAPAASAAGVPVIAFSSDRKVAMPGVYVIGFTPETEVERVVQFAIRSGLSKFAALAPDNLYGAAVADALRKAAVGNGGTVTRIQLYDQTTQDFVPVVRKLTGMPDPTDAVSPPLVTTAPPARPQFDALLLGEGGTQLRAMALALAAAGVGSPSVQLLGTGKWDEPGIGAEPALVGAWFAAPPPFNRDDFEVRYKRVFGQAPPRLATLAYDATALAAVVARGSQSQPFTEATLTDPSGFFGRDGLFRLNSDGTTDRKLAILRVDRNGVTVIDEPQRSFAAGS